MKKLFLLVVMCLFAAAAVAQQSLGDVARANRAKKHAAATTKLDDENFARSSTPEPPSKPESDVAKSADADAKKDSADAQKQKNEEMTKQIEAQKKEIASLQRELDVAQREARLRAAAYYADAGTML